MFFAVTKRISFELNQVKSSQVKFISPYAKIRRKDTAKRPPGHLGQLHLYGNTSTLMAVNLI